MGAEYRSHTHGIAGALKLHRTVDSIGVGAGECVEAPLRSGLRQCFRTGYAESEGEVGVSVEMGHLYSKREREKQER
jgi:hypothetical protein